ncbi:MAG: hypothetical protein NZ960_07470 [Candidatus Kapabacteria bacterium]|nr:hypothetical protein [Candidatus Kapabacteria bacterium]MDW8012820.1 hypothetical protein [Bacteroidota bacterium]
MVWWRTAAVVGAVVALVGCAKEESTEPTQPRNYFPFAVGNWWVYSGIRLDTSGAEIPGTEWRDSMVIVRQVPWHGRQAYVAVQYRSNDHTPDTMLLSSDGVRLYMFFPSTGEVPGPTGWVKVADYSASSWAIWDTTLTNVPLDPDNPQVTVSGSMRWRGERGNETLRLPVKGRQVEAQEFRVQASFDGKIFAQGREVGTITFTARFRWWVAEGIGVVRDQTDPAELRVQSSLISDTVKQEGERRVLVDYNVQQ